ncbi:hypothetical protein HPB47_011686 [Ixodes persulcatus]|uniref:Uncharacterized protein n=1 Tax=Ixodes persulcatus TaxID=34615 RepID=A0AC60NVR3_IXOPE|nr:hypothetical protein HPB47_011686 [Ixodes persulcatus]
MDSQEFLPGEASQHSSHPTWTADDTLEIPPPKKVKAAPVSSISPYPTPSPDRSFRLHIRPTVRFDVTAVPTKCIQHVIDQCLGTRGYQGFVIHKASNTITVHLASIEDADKICAISRVPINADNQLSVQAYFASEPNVQRCVVYGLETTDSCATIIQDLKSKTHTVLAGRRMGASTTHLVTIQGPQTLPEKFYYNGCIVRPKLYRPRAVYCYRRYQLGHLQKYCPKATVDPERTTPEGQPRYRCGLCKTDEHEITSSKCPTKQRASARARGRLKVISAPLIAYNSFQALEPAENTQPEEAEETALKRPSSYAAALKRPGEKGRQSAHPNSGNPPEPTGIPVTRDDLDTEIAQLSRQRKARVAARRKERAATPPHAGTQISPAPMPLQTENTTPFDPANWMAAEKSWATAWHLIRRIAPRSGGARTEVARRLVRSVLQPRLRRHESNHDTPSSYPDSNTARARSAQYTLTELVNQREQARILKRKHIPAAAALHSYFYGGPLLTAALDDIPPWCYTNITTNKTTKLRRSDQPAPTPETSIPQSQCVVYTDAAVLPRGGRASFVSPSHPGIRVTCDYKSDTPDSLLLELQAIHDAIKAFIGLSDIKEAHIHTDSLNSIKHLKQVTQTLQICQQIHILHQKTTINIKVHWMQGHSQNHSNLLADHHAHHTQPLLDLPPASLPSDPRSDLIAQKKKLPRRDTRALIPPCVCSFPRNLSRVEGVPLRRLRAGAALTPSVTWTWGHTPVDPGTCPKCPAPVATADAHHLLWLCSGTKTTREKILSEAGLKGHPHDNYTQWVNDNKYYKSLLQFLHDAELHSFL